MKQIILYFLFISGICFSQLDNTESISKTGTTSAQFLKIGEDARGASMGNAITAMSGGISSMYQNYFFMIDDFLLMFNNYSPRNDDYSTMFNNYSPRNDDYSTMFNKY